MRTFSKVAVAATIAALFITPAAVGAASLLRDAVGPDPGRARSTAPIPARAGMAGMGTADGGRA